MRQLGPEFITQAAIRTRQQPQPGHAIQAGVIPRLPSRWPAEPHRPRLCDVLPGATCTQPKRPSALRLRVAAPCRGQSSRPPSPGGPAVSTNTETQAKSVGDDEPRAWPAVAADGARWRRSREIRCGSSSGRGTNVTFTAPRCEGASRRSHLKPVASTSGLSMSSLMDAGSDRAMNEISSMISFAGRSPAGCGKACRSFHRSRNGSHSADPSRGRTEITRVFTPCRRWRSS